MTPEEFILWQYAMVDTFWPILQFWIVALIVGAFILTTWLVAAHLIRGGLSRI